MRKVSIHDAGIGVLGAALLFVVLFWRLGTPTFWDPDEAHYAETSREMIATGDWWAPYFNEQPFFDKPVLFHQLQAAAMRSVSDPELGARAVPALAALGLVAVTYWFAAVLISRFWQERNRTDSPNRAERRAQRREASRKGRQRLH